MAEAGVQAENEAEEVVVEEEGVELSEETKALLETSHEPRDPMAPVLVPAPDGVPEKFWDAEKGTLRTDDLLKSYVELERLKGSKEEATEETTEETSEETAEETTEKKPEGEEEKTEETSEEEQTPELASAIEQAQRVYAETGDLTAESRESLVKAGISNDQIDIYLQGVKAIEKSMFATAYEAAGNQETFDAAIEWARENWSETKIKAFDTSVTNPEMISLAVKGLVDEFSKANPGEGRLVQTTTSRNTGDVYHSMDEFQKDLGESERLRDPAKRREAVAKLERSRKAGTVKSDRKQPFRR